MLSVEILNDRNKRITFSKPIIRVRIGKDFLKLVNGNIYEINTKLLHSELYKQMPEMFEDPKHVKDFYPIGQIVMNTSRPTIDTMLVNRRIIPMTNNYKKLDDNVWYGKIKHSKSIGTIYSRSKPTSYIPVFSKKYLTKIDKNGHNSKYNSYDKFSNTYVHPSYSKYTINIHSIEVDKTKQMIGSDGTIQSIKDIHSTYVPGLNAIEHVFSMYGSSDLAKKYNKKYDSQVYYTTQGAINRDKNCVSPGKNRVDMHINECNAFDLDESVFDSLAAVDSSTEGFTSDYSSSYSNFSNSSSDYESSDTDSSNSSDSDSSDSNESISTQSVSDKIMSLSGNKPMIFGKGCVLKTKSNPWFKTGSLGNIKNSEKITHQSENLLLTSNEIKEILTSKKIDIVSDKNNTDTRLLLVGNFDYLSNEFDLSNENNIKGAPYTGKSCDIGYSMYDKLKRCDYDDSNINNTSNTSNTNNNTKSIEGFVIDSKTCNYNNLILLILFIIVSCLLIYKYY